METQKAGAEVLTAHLKGLPSKAIGLTPETLGKAHLRLLAGDLPLPAAVLKRTALTHNSTWMRDFTRRAGVSLCPHGKTTMAPQLFQRQMEDGAWGITAATASHVRIYRTFGIRRIILANQLVGRANFNMILDELADDPEFEFFMLIDSVAGLKELQTAVQEHGKVETVNVLLEVGIRNGRTGIRNIEDGLILGRAIHAAGPLVCLRGIEAFEGVFGGDNHAKIELSVHTMMETIAALAKVGCDEEWFAPGEVILTAGGSAFFDLAAAVLNAVEANRPIHVVLRSGCYLSHDSLHYQRMQARMRERSPDLWGKGPSLQNALEVWAYVQSVPETHRAICSLGKRDISYDLEMPQPLWWFRPGTHSRPQEVPSSIRTTALNDQHAYVDSLNEPNIWQVGDMVGFGVGHPCTTFDKWPLLFEVNDSYEVVGGIRTYF